MEKLQRIQHERRPEPPTMWSLSASAGPSISIDGRPYPVMMIQRMLGNAAVARLAGASGAAQDSAEHVHAAAKLGTSGASGPMPHLEEIQASFGRHDLSGVKAHTDSAAAQGSRAMSAEAFTAGKHVAFATAPDLFTAAHEAAHVVQQRAGVHLSGGVGRAGDPFERHADEVAARVVAGQSSEALLDRLAGPASHATSAAPPVQKKGDPVGPGYYAAGQTTREIGFALRHPIIALAVGSVSSGSTNISTNAARFATNDLGLKETKSHEGSEVNAFRHTLWQSKIARDYGPRIAKQIGNAHEENPFAISGPNRNITSFPTESKADESCDLRNNEIGRSIGTSSDPQKMNELALKVIEHFHTVGLWVSEKQADGTWSIRQRTISDATYKEARARLLLLNENGFDAEQQATRDAKAKKEMEMEMMRMRFGPKI
jgi:hypothetical protein